MTKKIISLKLNLSHTHSEGPDPEFYQTLNSTSAPPKGYKPESRRCGVKRRITDIFNLKLFSTSADQAALKLENGGAEFGFKVFSQPQKRKINYRFSLIFLTRVPLWAVDGNSLFPDSHIGLRHITNDNFGGCRIYLAFPK